MRLHALQIRAVGHGDYAVVERDEVGLLRDDIAGLYVVGQAVLTLLLPALDEQGIDDIAKGYLQFLV